MDCFVGDANRPYGTKIDVFSASLIIACVGQWSAFPPYLNPVVPWSDNTPPWLSELYEHTHRVNPGARWSSFRAAGMMRDVVLMQERDGVRSLVPPPQRSEASASSSVTGAG